MKISVDVQTSIVNIHAGLARLAANRTTHTPSERAPTAKVAHQGIALAKRVGAMLDQHSCTPMKAIDVADMAAAQRRHQAADARIAFRLDQKTNVVGHRPTGVQGAPMSPWRVAQRRQEDAPVIPPANVACRPIPAGPGGPGGPYFPQRGR